MDRQISQEKISRKFAFRIINNYYPLSMEIKGTFKLLKEYGVLLRTGAVVKANKREFYIEGSSRNINRTFSEVSQHQI